MLPLEEQERVIRREIIACIRESNIGQRKNFLPLHLYTELIEALPAGKEKDNKSMRYIADRVYPINDLWNKVQDLAYQNFVDSKEGMDFETRDKILDDRVQTVIYAGTKGIKEIFVKEMYEQSMKNLESFVIESRVYELQSILAYLILPYILEQLWKQYHDVHDADHEFNRDMIEKSLMCLFANYGYIFSSIIDQANFKSFIAEINKWKDKLEESGKFNERIFLPGYFNIYENKLNYMPALISRIYLEITNNNDHAESIKKHFDLFVDEKTNNKSHNQIRGAMILSALVLIKESSIQSYIILDTWRAVISKYGHGKHDTEKIEKIAVKVIKKYFNDVVPNGEELKVFQNLSFYLKKIEFFENRQSYKDRLNEMPKMIRHKLGVDSILGDISSLPTPLIEYFSHFSNIYRDEVDDNKITSSEIVPEKLSKALKDFFEIFYLYIVNSLLAWTFSKAEEMDEDKRFQNFFDKYCLDSGLSERMEKELYRNNEFRIHFYSNKMKTFLEELALKKEFNELLILNNFSIDKVIKIVNHLNSRSKVENVKYNELLSEIKSIKKLMKLFFNYEKNNISSDALEYYKLFEIYIPKEDSANCIVDNNDKIVHTFPFTKLEGNRPNTIDFRLHGSRIKDAVNNYNMHKEYPRFFKSLKFEDELNDNRSYVFPSDLNWIPLKPFILVEPMKINNDETSYSLQVLEGVVRKKGNSKIEYLYKDFIVLKRDKAYT